MHRLLTKKHRDDEQPKSSNKLRSFKRNKSQPPPASRPQVDLTQALPPTDDFRISLMMPNLEKRFSVLREGEEQEGPGATGMGYGTLASGTLFKDDKDGEFAKPSAAGLTDITEVASIRSGSRADGSFDLPGRAVQMDDYSGSIMDRPRQGEGNVLFGGRQKVFRVNTAAAGSDDVEDSPLSPIGRGRIGGRALYSDDLPAPNGIRKGSTVDRESPRSQSPPSNYNLDRNTQSSTNSGPSSLTRSSTAATSTSSNSRNFTPNNFVSAMTSTTSSKPRKLIYEQALDRDNSEREQNTLETHLENHKLAIMAQKRAGSTSPHPYSEEDEIRRAMSPPMRSFARPFSPPRHEEPETHGRHENPQDNFKPKIPSLRTSESSPALTTPKTRIPDVPFSFGFEQSNNSPKTISPTLQTSINKHGLPTPRPESDEYHDSQPPITATGPTPSPSPLTEKYTTSSISRDSEFTLDETQGTRPVSRQSLVSGLSQQPQMGPQSTFYDMSDSEREMNDGASSVYDDDEDPYIPFEQPIGSDIPVSPPHKPQRHIVPAFPLEKQTLNPHSVSPTQRSHDLTPLHDSDSPTLPPNAGLSNMIRQHLRSDSGISSIYTPSMHGKMSEPHPEPPSLAQALANWGNQYPDYDEEAPFQPEAPQVEVHEPKPKFSLAELKKKEMDEKKPQLEMPGATLKSIPMERNRSDNTLSTGDDETDEWRTQLEEKKRMLQQRLQEHSGRNSPAPGFGDSTEDLPKNSILKPGMLGNMLKGKSSPASTPSKEETKAMKILGISPLLNQSKESFGRREDEDEVTLDRSEERLRPMQSRPDMHPPHADARSRGPGPMPGQRPHPPYGQGLPGRPYPPNHGPGPHNQGPMNGPRSFLPMTAQPQNSSRKGPGHIPIEASMPPASNMHREFVEQGRGGQRPPGPGMPPHLQHRSPPSSRGYESTGRSEFRPPHDRQDRQDPRGPPSQQGGRPRTRSNAQPPSNESMHRSPPHSKGATRQKPSEEDLRGRQRGPSTRIPGVNDMNGVMTTVTTGTAPLPLNIDKKPQSSKGKQLDPIQQKEPQLRNDVKASEAPARDRRPGNLNIPSGEVSQSRFSTEDSPQASGFVGRFRSNSKSHKITSIAMFEQENASQPSLPSQPKLSQPVPTSISKPLLTAPGTAQTLAELTGSDGANPAFQKTGAPAAGVRDGKKMRIRKADISEPTLLHTTSQMPVSNLIDAGSKVYHRVLPPGLSDSPQMRQRSGSDESMSRIPGGAAIPLQGQRTSGADGDRTRTLRKAASDGSGLRERAASSAKHRPAMPSAMPYFGADGRPLNTGSHGFPNNAPAGMI